jgi:hypothetical protein
VHKWNSHFLSPIGGVSALGIGARTWDGVPEGRLLSKRILNGRSFLTGGGFEELVRLKDTRWRFFEGEAQVPFSFLRSVRLRVGLLILCSECLLCLCPSPEHVLLWNCLSASSRGVGTLAPVLGLQYLK